MVFPGWFFKADVSLRENYCYWNNANVCKNSTVEPWLISLIGYGENIVITTVLFSCLVL